MTDMMDVKSFAAAAGISTQRVYALLNTKLQPYCNRSSGKTLISSDALTVIGVEPALQTDDKQLLEKLVTTLQDQLTVKDEQIKLLQTELSVLSASYRQVTDSLARLLDQQQRLNAAQMGLLPESAENKDDISDTVPKRKNWLQKLLNKNA